MSEWAQLLAGPPSPHAALERGHWYRVEARTKDGIVWVMGPNAVGRPVAESLVRIINHEPEKVTRVQATGFQRVLPGRSEEHTSELQSRPHLVCRLLLEKKKKHKLIDEFLDMTKQL